MGSCWGQEGGLAREEGLVGGPLLLNHLQACLHYTALSNDSHLPQPLQLPARSCSVHLTVVHTKSRGIGIQLVSTNCWDTDKTVLAKTHDQPMTKQSWLLPSTIGAKRSSAVH